MVEGGLIPCWLDRFKGFHTSPEDVDRAKRQADTLSSCVLESQGYLRAKGSVSRVKYRRTVGGCGGMSYVRTKLGAAEGGAPVGAWVRRQHCDLSSATGNVVRSRLERSQEA
jgi:hypothetical protein